MDLLVPFLRGIVSTIQKITPNIQTYNNSKITKGRLAKNVCMIASLAEFRCKLNNTAPGDSTETKGQNHSESVTKSCYIERICKRFRKIHRKKLVLESRAYILIEKGSGTVASCELSEIFQNGLFMEMPNGCFTGHSKTY